MWHKADGEVLIVIELAKIAHGGIGDHGSDRARERIDWHTNEPVIEPRVRYCSDSDCGLNEDGDDGDGGRAAKECKDSDGGAGPGIPGDESQQIRPRERLVARRVVIALRVLPGHKRSSSSRLTT